MIIFWYLCVFSFVIYVVIISFYSCIWQFAFLSCNTSKWELNWIVVIIIVVVTYFLFADDTKIFSTVNSQLTVHSHNWQYTPTTDYTPTTVSTLPQLTTLPQPIVHPYNWKSTPTTDSILPQVTVYSHNSIHSHCAANLILTKLNSSPLQGKLIQ